MDVLADFLKTAGVTAKVDAVPFVESSWLHGPKRSAIAAQDARLTMLCVASGEYSLITSDRSQSLTQGDALFLLDEHDCRVERVKSASSLITGSIVFRAGAMALATLKLSSATVVRGQDNPESMELVMRLATEVQRARGGWEQIGESLATSLFITSLRLSESCENKESGQGWLRALVDPEIGNALSLMHQAPEYRWTVAELADRLSISRSAFADRFKRITGRPPLEYLTWWRLQRAAARLASGESTTLYELARSSGYQSEAAFSKAFRREFGMPPGAIRRQAFARKNTPSQLQLEIKKRQPFEHPEQEASLNLVKSYEAMRSQFEELFSVHGLTSAEYNILRILRGRNCPMAMDEVVSHLLIPHANPTKVMRQLLLKQLVAKVGDAARWEITEQGKSLLAQLDAPTLYIHRRQLAHFSDGEIAELNRLLVKLRTPAS